MMGFSLTGMQRAAFLGVLLLSGCATYHSKPLPTAPDLARVSELTVPASQFEIPRLKPRSFPTNGLDETAVITLAVFNNPDLKAARLQAGVAGAELLEAGLLPDPQVSGGLGQSAFHNGYNIGLSEDIQALITRGAAKAAAKAHKRQVNLDILWQEWQVAEKARELFIQSRANSQLLRVLTATRDLLADRYRENEAALNQGNMGVDVVSADLAALTDADANLRQLELDINVTRHELNQLLGLRPEVELSLIGRSESRSLSREECQTAVAALPHRRADLLALQAGYQSQEQRLREAILAQFPSMSAGVEQGRDPIEGVNTIGLTVNVTVPLFNRNKGQIAIQQATRAVLYEDYQVRLDQAAGAADQIWQATQTMSRQLRDLDARLSAQEKIAVAAEQNFRQGNLDATTYVSLQSNYLAGRTKVIQLRATLENAQSALEMLLGLPFSS